MRSLIFFVLRALCALLVGFLLVSNPNEMSSLLVQVIGGLFVLSAVLVILGYYVSRYRVRRTRRQLAALVATPDTATESVTDSDTETETDSAETDTASADSESDSASAAASASATAATTSASAKTAGSASASASASANADSASAAASAAAINIPGPSPVNLFVGIGSAALGAFLLLSPLTFTDILIYVLGGVLILIGLGQAVTIIRARRVVPLSFALLLLPVLVVATGTFIILKSQLTNQIAFTILGIAYLCYGATELVYGVQFYHCRKRGPSPAPSP